MAFMFRIGCPIKVNYKQRVGIDQQNGIEQQNGFIEQQNGIEHDGFIENPIKPSRRILSHEHIRDLIDKNYVPDESWYNFATIAGITALLRRKYSQDITQDMVYESLLLDPPKKISYNMDAPGCRFIKRIY